MVLANDIVAEAFEYSADAIADYCTSQMADVHLLGNIRAGKIYNDSFRFSSFIYTKIGDVPVDFKQPVG